MTTAQILESRGYSQRADGTFSRADSHRVTTPVSAPVVKRSKVKREPSGLEMRFAAAWRALNGPELVTEHVFLPPRRWRLDFAHLKTKIAIEIEGLTRQGGRHQRIGGYKADCEKYYAAAEAGWTVYRLTDNMITSKRLIGIIQAIQATTD